MVSVEIQANSVSNTSSKYLHDVMELTNIESFKLEIYTGQLSPVLEKDLKSLKNFKTFHLRQKPQSNQNYKRSIKGNDLKIVMPVYEPENFEFVLDYVDCSFNFQDLKHILNTNNYKSLKAYVNNLKYESELNYDIV